MGTVSARHASKEADGRDGIRLHLSARAAGDRLQPCCQSRSISVAIAFYKTSVESYDPTRSLNYGYVAFVAVALVSVTCFFPFAGGYPAG